MNCHLVSFLKECFYSQESKTSKLSSKLAEKIKESLKKKDETSNDEKKETSNDSENKMRDGVMNYLNKAKDKEKEIVMKAKSPEGIFPFLVLTLTRN